jgi:hypothetical protein
LQQQQTLLLLLLLLMLATRGTLAWMLVACLCLSLGLNHTRQQSGINQQLLQVLPAQQQQQGSGWVSQMHKVMASMILLLLKVVLVAARHGV